MLLVALAVPDVTPGADPARALLDLLVTEAGLGPAPGGRECRVCGGPHGAPAHPRASLSLSRTAGLVAAAVSTCAPVGVDVESASATAFPGFPGVALGPGEADGGPADRARLWARKEAALKAAGVGLTVDPRRVRVTGSGAAPAVLGWPLPDPVLLVDLPAPDGWAACLAVLSADPLDVRLVDGGLLLSRAAPAAG